MQLDCLALPESPVCRCVNSASWQGTGGPAKTGAQRPHG